MRAFRSHLPRADMVYMNAGRRTHYALTVYSRDSWRVYVTRRSRSVRAFLSLTTPKISRIRRVDE